MSKRRTFLQSTVAGALSACSYSAFAHTKLTGSEIMMPVDTRNDRGGWLKPAVAPVQIKGFKLGEGLPKLIASTTANTPEGFLKQVEIYANTAGLDCVDMRPDYIGKISGKDFAELTKKAYPLAKQLGVEVSLRDKYEGGARIVPDDEYDVWWTEFFENGGKADFVDLEMFRDIKVVRKGIKMAHERGIKVMISDHEFGWTPSEDDMIRRLIAMEKEGSDILKLAAWAHNFDDCLRLMSATWKYRRYYGNKPLVTMSMGAIGCLSRVTGEFSGSDMTFVIVGDKGSAPGQFPIKDAQQIINDLHATMTTKSAQKRTDR